MNGNNQTSDDLAIGSLAARLLAAGVPSDIGPGRAAAAVRAARSLMNELKKQPRIHACELFDSDTAMSIEDIASILREHQYEKLTSTNSVTKRVSEILTALHRDIQRRENLVAAAFKQLNSQINPDDAELVAKRMLLELLERTGISLAFNSQCEEVASAIWQHMIERFLIQQQSTAAQIQNTRNHTREYFELVCAELSYDEFTARMGPVSDLGAGELLDLLFWLKHRFETHWNPQTIDQDDLDRLEAINRLPGRFYPNDRTLSRPFTTFLAEYHAGNHVSCENAAHFHKGLHRLNGLQQRLRIKELVAQLLRLGSSVKLDGNHEVREPSTKPSADSIIDSATLATTAEATKTTDTGDRADCERESHSGCVADLVLHWLKDLRSGWWGLNDDARFSMMQCFVMDPMNLVAQAEQFLSEGRILALGAQPFDGNQVPDKLLRPYARDLEILLRCLKGLQSFAVHLGRTSDVVMPLLKFLDAESKRWQQSALTLSDEGSQELEMMVSRGQEIFNTLSYLAVTRIGRIRPHLLFSYARDSGIL